MCDDIPQADKPSDKGPTYVGPCPHCGRDLHIEDHECDQCHHCGRSLGQETPLDLGTYGKNPAAVTLAEIMARHKKAGNTKVVRRVGRTISMFEDTIAYLDRCPSDPIRTTLLRQEWLRVKESVCRKVWDAETISYTLNLLRGKYREALKKY